MRFWKIFFVTKPFFAKDSLKNQFPTTYELVFLNKQIAVFYFRMAFEKAC
jgi:hypothetical protein